jgi:cobalt-zinc-cadmium efflux system outer membrane protein
LLRAIRIRIGLLFLFLLPSALAQKTYTWQELRERFESSNPTLQAAQENVTETRAMEITAYLRPNPDATFGIDQLEPFVPNPYRPFSQALPSASISYLHERRHKRELRLEAAKQGTAIAESQLQDQRRTLLFSLRNAYVQLLQAKAVYAQAKDNIEQYDKVIDVNRERKKAGDIAQVDLDRIELMRVQFESDLQTAEVNLRTAKINVLTLLNDRTPINQFDATGPFDFSDSIEPLDDLRRQALEARPDLKAAVETVEQARSNYRLAVANGSTDPTFGFDIARNPPSLSQYIGFNVSIPLRIFDRNQGEKARTAVDIRRNQKLLEANQAQVFSDVDSAYAMVNSTVALLKPYKDHYLAQSTRVRDTINFSYQHGAASLLDFLQAQQDYRATQVTYLNLIGSYLTAASQLNMAVGREVIQ